MGKKSSSPRPIEGCAVLCFIEEGLWPRLGTVRVESDAGSDNLLVGLKYFRLGVNKVQVGASDKQNWIQDNVEN